MEIKWSKKEVLERPILNLGSARGRFKAREPIGGTYKVNVYRWEDYRLEKELYGSDNRLFYHLAKGDKYLCHTYSGSPEVKKWSNIKSATRHLEYILENDGLDRECWADPKDGFIWGLFA